MNHINVDCVLDIKANLGESPIWSTKDQILYWVDINNHLICKFDPKNKTNSTINVGDFVGCFALKKNLNIVLALTNGFFELEHFIIISMHAPSLLLTLFLDLDLFQKISCVLLKCFSHNIIGIRLSFAEI